MASATLNGSNYSLLDLAKIKDPQGRIVKPVEAMAKKSGFLQSAMFREGNLDTGHRVAVENGLPSIYSRRINQGVPSSKSSVSQFDETCGFIEGRSKMDVLLARLNGGLEGRSMFDSRFLERFQQVIEASMFYSNSKAVVATLTANATSGIDNIEGLTPRFNSTTGTGGAQIVRSDTANAGTESFTSIWGVVWGDGGVYGITPKGVSAGFEIEDRGIQTVSDGTNELEVYLTVFRQAFGLCVEDRRQVTRIANIDSASSATAAGLEELMIDAHYTLHAPGAGNLVWYCNRRIEKYLHKQALANVKSTTYAVEDFGGQKITTFLGRPIVISDALTNTETFVS